MRVADLLWIDVRRATSEGAPGLAVDAADLAALEPALNDAAARLVELQEGGQVGFLSIGQASWALDETQRQGQRLAGLADVLLVLGIGGSALGARALQGALGPGADGRRVEVLDTVDPARVAPLLRALEPARTAVALISKSGGTLETVALWRVVQPWLVAALGEGWRERIVVITDPTRGGLREMARREGLSVLPVPADVGGRFSVLTAVGMLPAAFLGLDGAGLIEGARIAAEAVRTATLDTNPAFAIAAVHDAWYRAGARISVLCAYSSRLRVLGDWFAQLLAESLGKQRPDGTAVGWTPSVGEGPVDQHSQMQLWQQGPKDKLVTLLSVEDGGEDLPLQEPAGAAGEPGAWLAGRTLGGLLKAERQGTLAALALAGRPVMQITLARLDAAAFGALIVTLQAAVAYAGDLLGIDPFDQPGVEAGKRFAGGLLGRPGYEADGLIVRQFLES
jgi:glucose-6-phosphate isomerase